MTCQETEARLTDLLDRRLAPNDEIRMHAHLEGCAVCRERVATWEALTPAMRDLVPPRLEPLAIRRMEVELERALSGTATPAKPRWSWLEAWRLRPAMLLGTAAAAVVVLATWFVLRPGAGAPAFATVERINGGAMTAGAEPRALGAGTTLVAGSEVVVAAGTTLGLTLNGQASLAIDGPARLALLGDPAHVLLRLAAGTTGTMTSDVVHRKDGETFAVELSGMRVEVRGTRFQVGYREQRPWVAVHEGRVAVLSPGHAEHLVSTGERYQPAEAAPPANAIPAAPAADAEETTPEVTSPSLSPAPATATAETAPTAMASCADAPPVSAAVCDSQARRARTAMRSRHYARALSFVDEGLSRAAAPAGCPRPEPASARAAACLDDLRYLRAEALRLDGRLEQAVATYRSLDRVSAPVAMRQNALYAAGQIEQRLGRARAAYESFERALAIAPKGALREESMLGAMEAAEAGGDASSARSAARRYLASFPDGRGATAARRLSGSPGAR